MACVRPPIAELARDRHARDVAHDTLFIQRAEHRDTQAIQAKLDELLHAEKHARNSLTHIDEAEPEDIEGHRERTRERDG